MRIRPSSLLALALVSCATTEREAARAPAAAARSALTPPVTDPPPGDASRAALDEAAPPGAPAEPARLELPSASDLAPANEDAEQRMCAAAIAAINAHDYAKARAIIDDLATAGPLAEARVLLSQRRLDEALAATRRAVALAPGEPRVLLLHAEASLQFGAERSDRERLEDSLRTYLFVGDSPEALFGASRAARTLGRVDDALHHARQGWAAWQAQGAPDNGAFFERPERTLALAAWDAFDAATLGAPDASARAGLEALASETTIALTRALALQPDDAQSWQRLAELDARMGRLAGAQATLEQAFAALPSNEELAARLAAVARERGGSAEVLEAFARLRSRGVAGPLVWSTSAHERFESALAALADGPLAELALAESEFAAARAQDPGRREEYLRSEALCRCATGWVEFAAGDLKAAVAAFRSMKQPVAHALAYDVPGRLRSGVLGLAAVGEAYTRSEELESAAALFNELHSYELDSIEWAARAGAAYRDAAERLTLLADDCRRASEGKLTDRRKLQALREAARISPNAEGASLATEFRLAADERAKKARGWFERSYQRFKHALRLAPTDVRLMNDAALVAVYHLDTDLDDAKSLLNRSVASCQQSLANAQLDASARRALSESLGDAYQLLGILYLEREVNPARAQQFFEKSLQTESGPRPAIRDSYLPRCAELLQRRN